MKRRVYLMILAAVLAVIFAALVERAKAQTNSTPLQEANSLFTAEKWAESAAAFESVTKAEPTNGLAWFRLGLSLHAMGQYRRAIEIYQHVDKLHFNPIGVLYRIGRAYARLGEKERAVEFLDKAVTAGLPYQIIESDSDLAVLGDDARYKEVLARAERAARPCAFEPEFKQFDFWVGEWDVKPTQSLTAPSVGTNSITRIEDGCIIMENWTGAAGGTGKSMNFFNRAAGRWQQTWVSSGGTVLELHGEYRDGAMRFEGESIGKGGAKIKERLTFFNLGPDRVRQFAEQSADGGKTWTVRYDLTYLRKK